MFLVALKMNLIVAVVIKEKFFSFPSFLFLSKDFVYLRETDKIQQERARLVRGQGGERQREKQTPAEQGA